MTYTGDVLRVAMAVLCVAAVCFLLRVLAALVKEAMRLPPEPVKVYLAKFSPSRSHTSRSYAFRQTGELVPMTSDAQQRNFPFKAGERIALLALLTVCGDQICKTFFG